MPDLYNNAIDCAEDDYSRSNYVRSLVRNPESLTASSLGSKNTIPKVVVQFWDNPDRMPKDVRRCLDSWRPLVAKGFDRLLFDDQTARSFISNHFGATNVEAFDRCYHPAMRCDYFRLCYILSNGGFYVDADEIYQGKDIHSLFVDDKLKVQPLCYDTEADAMIDPHLFIKGKDYSPNWIFYFNNNPLIAPEGHPVISLALERATKLLLTSKETPEIQSTTGPGNLTASVVRYFLSQEQAGERPEFLILSDWGSTSVSPWPLSYRNDARNWRFLTAKRPEREDQSK